MVRKANNDGVRLRMPTLKMNAEIILAGNRAGRRGGERVAYGEATFKRNRPSFAVLLVLWVGRGLSFPLVLAYLVDVTRHEKSL